MEYQRSEQIYFPLALYIESSLRYKSRYGFPQLLGFDAMTTYNGKRVRAFRVSLVFKGFQNIFDIFLGGLLLGLCYA